MGTVLLLFYQNQCMIKRLLENRKEKEKIMKKKLVAMLGIGCMFISAVSLNGCGNAQVEEELVGSEGEDNQASAEETEVITEEENTEPTQNLQEETVQEDADVESDTEESMEDGFDFSKLANCEFYFSSGVGGWGTELTIDEKGNFEGNYHDSDMGDTGEGYPGGTCYYCKFHGKFDTPIKVNDYTYSTKILEISQENESGTEEVIDEVLYKYSDPYGLENAAEIYIYLPDAKIKDLPEGYMSWARMAVENREELGFYGLYNVAQEEGFTSYENDQTEKITENTETSFAQDIKSSTDIDTELSQVEEKEQELDAKLQAGDLTQMDMNQTSYEIYKLWDDELNSIWARLKTTLPEDEMAKLTTQQKQWISDKEKAVKEAGAECEGGSIQPCIENDKASELTKKRVYELAGYLK